MAINATTWNDPDSAEIAASIYENAATRKWTLADDAATEQERDVHMHDYWAETRKASRAKLAVAAFRTPLDSGVGRAIRCMNHAENRRQHYAARMARGE